MTNPLINKLTQLLQDITETVDELKQQEHARVTSDPELTLNNLIETLVERVVLSTGKEEALKLVGHQINAIRDAARGTLVPVFATAWANERLAREVQVLKARIDRLHGRMETTEDAEFGVEKGLVDLNELRDLYSLIMNPDYMAETIQKEFPLPQRKFKAPTDTSEDPE